MFHLAPVTISTHLLQFYTSCGADKMCVFLRLAAKISDRFSVQRISIKFCA